jgi:hypothetical protein
MENIEHLAIILGVIATAFGLLKGLRGWRGARDEAIAARARQEDGIARVLAHMDNGGAMLVDKVDKGNKMLADHMCAADQWFKANDSDHKDIHRRIDGVFELLAGSGATQPRKAAERHRAVRNNEDEVG